MRKFIIAIILLLGLIFLFASLGEIREVLNVLQEGQFGFLLAAASVQIGWMVVMGLIFQSIYRLMDLEESASRMFNLAASAYFVSRIAPSAGMSGLAVYVSDGKLRGHPAGRVMVAGLLYVLLDYLGLLIVTVLGLSFLWFSGRLLWSEIVAEILLLLSAFGLSMVFWLGARSEYQLGRMLSWLARQVNRIVHPFIHRDSIDPEKAFVFAHDTSEAIKSVRFQPRRLLAPVGYTLLGKLLCIVILGLVFKAFQVAFTPGVLVASFSIGNLFTIMSPTPSGIGVVEGMLTLALTSLGVPLEAATVITLAYRAITFWSYLAVGFVAFRIITPLQQKTQLK